MSSEKSLHINTKAIHWFEGANVRSGSVASAMMDPDIFSKVSINGTVVHTSQTLVDVKEGDTPYWHVYNDTFLLPYNTENDCVSWTWVRKGSIWDTPVYTSNGYSIQYLKKMGREYDFTRRTTPEDPNTKHGFD